MHRANVVVHLGRFLKPGNAEAGADFDDLDMGMGRKRHRRSKASLYQLVRGYSLFHGQGCANSPQCLQWGRGRSFQARRRAAGATVSFQAGSGRSRRSDRRVGNGRTGWFAALASQPFEFPQSQDDVSVPSWIKQATTRKFSSAEELLNVVKSDDVATSACDNERTFRPTKSLNRRQLGLIQIGRQPSLQRWVDPTPIAGDR